MLTMLTFGRHSEQIVNSSEISGPINKSRVSAVIVNVVNTGKVRGRELDRAYVNAVNF
jgi:hypothetical protein